MPAPIRRRHRRLGAAAARSFRVGRHASGRPGRPRRPARRRRPVEVTAATRPALQPPLPPEPRARSARFRRTPDRSRQRKPGLRGGRAPALPQPSPFRTRRTFRSRSRWRSGSSSRGRRKESEDGLAGGRAETGRIRPECLPLRPPSRTGDRNPQGLIDPEIISGVPHGIPRCCGRATPESNCSRLRETKHFLAGSRLRTECRQSPAWTCETGSSRSLGSRVAGRWVGSGRPARAPAGSRPA